jgi:uncharacterized membrane-anchored protein YitT (DUF2179 family)
MKKVFLILSLSIVTSLTFGQSKKINKAQPKDSTKSALAAKPLNTTFRVRYDQVFKINENGSVSPLWPVQIGGVTMGRGVAFTQGVSMGGIDIASYKGHDLLIDTLKGIVIIRNIFQ